MSKQKFEVISLLRSLPPEMVTKLTFPRLAA